MKRIVVSTILMTLLLIITFIGITSCSDSSTPSEPDKKASVSGVIKDSKTNQCILGASVTIEPGGGSPDSQNEGKYNFEKLDAGTYKINVVADGYIDDTKDVIVKAGDDKASNFNLIPLSKIYGVVRCNQTSESLAGVKVQITETGVSKTTNEGGVYRFDGLVGGKEYTLIATKNGYNTATESITIEIGEEGEANILMNELSPVLEVSPSELNFGNNESLMTFQMSNATGFGTVNYSIKADIDWITFSQIQGNFSSEIKTISVNVDRSNLAYNSYYQKITVNSNAGSQQIDVIVEVQNPNLPVLNVSTNTLTFGEDFLEKSFQVTNTGGGALNWNIDKNENWISFSQESGSTNNANPTDIQVIIDKTGLTSGDYQDQTTVTSNGGTKIINVSMTVVASPELLIDIDEVDFSSNIQNLSFVITNAGSGDLNWEVSDNKNWISCTPASGTNQGTVYISVDRSLLPDYGNYSGLITVMSNGVKYPLSGKISSHLRFSKTISENNKTSKNIDVLVEYNPENQAPSADFSLNPNCGNLQTFFQLDASVSSDDSDDVSQLQVRWKWETGSTFTPWIYTKTASHKYDSYGAKNITLEVKDSGGLTSSISKEVEVLNEPPEAEFVITPDTGTTETNFIFNASGCSNNEDPTSALQVRWDFDGNGSWDTNYSTTKMTSYIFTTAGNYTPKLQVKDTEGLTAITVKNLVVTAVNTAPTAIFILSSTVGTIETNFNFNANGCIDNEDPISVLQVRWDFEGDGSWDTNYSTTKTISHTYTTAGNYTPKLEVKDLGGLTDIEVTSDIVIYGEMVFVQGATFQMGDRLGSGIDDQKPVHEVTLSSFYIGKYEVTQIEYQRVMESNPSFNSGASKPVEKVTWRDAVDFCDWLSILEGYEQCYTFNGASVSCDFSKNGYRLSTEAEWEYAARGGENHTDNYQYSGTSNNLNNYAWYSINSGSITHDVGLKTANQLGLYDMTGNVWEWCWDWYGSNYYSVSPSSDPQGPSSGDNRIIRGGSFKDDSSFCTVSARVGIDHPYGYDDLGFRVVRTP